MNSLYFVIGANGVGKTTLILNLKKGFVLKPFEIYDFDERGVPDNADENWRKAETRYWIEKAKENTVNQKPTIICGFSNPDEVKEVAEELGVSVHVILLDANKEVIVQRVLGRYLTLESRTELERTCGKSPEKFAEDSAYISSKLRESAQSLGYEVVDTSNLTPEKVAIKVIELISES